MLAAIDVLDAAMHDGRLTYIEIGTSGNQVCGECDTGISAGEDLDGRLGGIIVDLAKSVLANGGGT